MFCFRRKRNFLYSKKDNSYFLPSRSPEYIKIKDILNGLKRYGEISDNIAKSEKNRFIYDILDKIERAQNEAAGEVNLKDIVSIASA